MTAATFFPGSVMAATGATGGGAEPPQAITGKGSQSFDGGDLAGDDLAGEEPRSARQLIPLRDQPWGSALIKYMKETQGTYGDSVRQFSVKSGIPYSSLQNLLAGKGGLSFEDFLSLAGYARISPQGLMTAILPKPAGKPRPTVRALVAAEPILEQIEIAHEVLDRASQTIDRRPPQGT